MTVTVNVLGQAFKTVTLVSRLDLNGALDRSFAGDGIAEFAFGEYGAVISNVMVGSHDDVVITGYELGSIDQHAFTSRIVGSPADNPSWNNAGLNEDTNNDGFVSAIDVLLVINFLNSHSTSNLPPERSRGEAFVDVTNDGIVSALDALQVINLLNSGTGNAEGENDTVWPDVPRLGTICFPVEVLSRSKRPPPKIGHTSGLIVGDALDD